jgi:hypothetical protein
LDLHADSITYSVPEVIDLYVCATGGRALLR